MDRGQSSLTSTGDILRKKMRPAATEMGPALAWWHRFADQVLRDVCKEQFGLDVELADPQGRQAFGPDALKALDKVTLPFLLENKKGKAGLFVIDGALIDGLIEQQMLGRIMPTPRLDRPVTAIDAGLSEGFVRATLSGLAKAPAEITGLTNQGPQKDLPTLRLALGEGQFDILSAKLNMGPGIKTGYFELWYPQEPARVVKPPSSGPNPAIMDALQDCPIELSTRMSGCQVSAKTLLNLKLGSVLHLPATALTQIEMHDCDGRLVAKGRLGQLSGVRAVRLAEMRMGGAVVGGQAAASPAEPKPTVPAPVPEAGTTAQEPAFEEGQIAAPAPQQPTALTGS